ncbi:MAG: putative toxin-antitoxin system toxin component, PIN family [Acidobacteriota bacterium]|nr:putative toxin-antitoxin system toxin component, PIN family [Acidobacteriota bacterium]
MRIVVDTNVLVSGLLSPFGPPGTVVGLIAASRLSLCYDARILAEYAEVLRRPRFPFSEEDVSALLLQVEAGGELTFAAPTPIRLPDPADEPFLEVAVASMADYLVTGNVRHFPDSARQGVRIVSPREFVDTGLRPG